MKQVWYSIRATVAVIIVVALCLFAGIFTYLGKIEGAVAFKELATLATIIVTFYFTLKRRDNTHPPDIIKLVETPSNPRPKLPGVVRRAK